ncbi:MAG: 50S ribosomal protein L28 [Bdellovibrionales bacterium]|nr:50S ribosomal protein L28 [Bdellovibrionales bacterium]
MARCELTGKGPVVKNLVSHSNIKTKFKAFPNVQKKKFFSNALGEFVTLKVATSAIKSLEHFGGFDKFILNQDNKKLSPRAMTAKTRIIRKIAGGAKKAAKGMSTGAKVAVAAAAGAAVVAAAAGVAMAASSAATKGKKTAAKKTATKKAKA